MALSHSTKSFVIYLDEVPYLSTNLGLQYSSELENSESCQKRAINSCVPLHSRLRVNWNHIYWKIWTSTRNSLAILRKKILFHFEQYIYPYVGFKIVIFEHRIFHFLTWYRTCNNAFGDLSLSKRRKFKCFGYILMKLRGCFFFFFVIAFVVLKLLYHQKRWVIV